MSATDPRGYITPDAFRVAPHLLGLPLASPSRRAAAMMLDLLLVGFLVSVGGGVLFGLAAAGLFFKMASARFGSRLPRPMRGGLRLGGATVLFFVGMNVWDGMGSGDEAGSASEPTRTAERSEPGERGAISTALSTAQMVSAFGKLEKADSRDEARREMRRVVTSLREVGVDDAAIASAIRGYTAEGRGRFVRAAATEMLATLPATKREADSARPASPDSLARAWASAFAAGDTATAGALRPQLAAHVAADTLSALQQRVEKVREERDAARQERDTALASAERMEKAGLFSVMRNVADELGLGFGWTGLYFTFFLSFWKGQTPGKRMLGMRVVRLDGKRFTLWSSFERFGGYAASLFTGLLGFFQILWDRNRQGMHDKIVETVVVRLIPGIEELTLGTAQAAPVPGPAPASPPDRRGVPPLP